MSWRFWTHSVTPRQEKNLLKRCSTQRVEARSTTTRWSERWILGLVMFQYLCVVVVYVGYLLCCILVMFDVVTHLLCCILGYLICGIGLLCVCYIFYMQVLEAPQANKIGNFF
jgi:hypothetical protein